MSASEVAYINMLIHILKYIITVVFIIIAIYKIPRLISTIAITDKLNKKYKINIDSIKNNHKGSKPMYEYTSSYKEILDKRAKLQYEISCILFMIVSILLSPCMFSDNLAVIAAYITFNIVFIALYITDIAYLKDNNLEWLEINTLDKYKRAKEEKVYIAEYLDQIDKLMKQHEEIKGYTTVELKEIINNTIKSSCIAVIN